MLLHLGVQCKSLRQLWDESNTFQLARMFEKKNHISIAIVKAGTGPAQFSVEQITHQGAVEEELHDVCPNNWPCETITSQNGAILVTTRCLDLR